MKALSLWQPWASLIACGAKSIETRSWPAPHWVVGETIAIHAAKHRGVLSLARDGRYKRALDQARAHGHLALIGEELPLGFVLATAVVVRCDAIDETYAHQLRARDPDEHAFGNYDPGRHAWVLDQVTRIVPLPWRGMQGLFDIPRNAMGLPPEVNYHQETLL